MSNHIFISYVRENAEVVDRLAADLEARGLSVWVDRRSLQPGARWREAVRNAIRGGDLFVACFSAEYASRDRSQMNEELTLAIEELRLRPTDRSWFIPVRLDRAPVPVRAISSSETLQDLQWVDLADDWARGVNAIAKVALSRRHLSAESRESSGSLPQAVTPKSETVEDMALRLDRERAEAQERDRLYFSVDGVQAALAERDALYAAITAIARRISLRSDTLTIDVELNEPTIATRAAGHSVVVTWVQTYSNSLSESALYILEYEGLYYLSGISLATPRELSRTRCVFSLRNGMYGWQTSDAFIPTA